MKPEKIIRSLDIDLEGEYNSDGQYVVDIPDSKTYLKAYSKLDKSDVLYELEENNLITEHNVSVSYLYEDEDAEISIVADLDNEEYKIVVNKFVYKDEDKDEE